MRARDREGLRSGSGGTIAGDIDPSIVDRDPGRTQPRIGDTLADPAVGPIILGRFPPFAHQEHLPDMLRVLRKVDEGRGEVRARDVVRTVGEILPPGLGSNPARLGSVREIRRSDNRPVERTRGNETLHPSKVGIGFSQNPADEIDHNPRPLTFDRRDTHADEAPDPGFAHRVEFRARDVAHHGCRTTAFGDDDRDDGILSAHRASHVLQVPAVPANHRFEPIDLRQRVGTASERRHRVPTEDPLVEDQSAGATRRADHGDVPTRFRLIRLFCVE